MTETRARVIPLEGPAAVLDPADPGPFAAIAGGQFLGMDGDLAMYRDGDGHMGHAHAGWVVIRPEGSDVASFCSPGRAVVEGG